MTHTKVITLIAQLIDARKRCETMGNTEWFSNHTSRLESIAKDILPSGSGVDNGTTIDLDRSTPDCLVLSTAFHHMDESGGYNGWTEHLIKIRPSLAFGFTVTIGGRNRHDIKDYLGDLFQHVLNSPVDETRDDQGWSTFRIVQDTASV